jgi:hypothetical protein
MLAVIDQQSAVVFLYMLMTFYYRHQLLRAYKYYCQFAKKNLTLTCVSTSKNRLVFSLDPDTMLSVESWKRLVVAL